jgi:hypothetical protein
MVDSYALNKLMGVGYTDTIASTASTPTPAYQQQQQEYIQPTAAITARGANYCSKAQLSNTNPQQGS